MEIDGEMSRVHYLSLPVYLVGILGRRTLSLYMYLNNNRGIERYLGVDPEEIVITPL